MIFARFEKRGPAGRERDDFPTSLRCRRLAVGMGRSDLAEFLEVPITAVRNWSAEKAAPRTRRPSSTGSQKFKKT